MKIAVRLKSTDSPMQRAANMLELAGIKGGDPKILADQQREIARAVAEYQALDTEAGPGPSWPDKSKLMAGR